MTAVFKKEISLFLSSVTGFIAILVFFAASAMVLFIFPETSVLDYGYATMDSFFNFAPYVLLFLIPAITMRLFSEEKSLRTLELLRTKPLHLSNIIVGKYFAGIIILLVAIIPTFFFVYIIGQLAEPVYNIDVGGITGSYIGLFFLAACFMAIGLFASALSNNQIIAFVVALFLCFAMYSIFTSVSNIPWFMGKSDYFIKQFGLESHYTSMSRGVVELRDVAYFLSVIIFFLWITFAKLQSESN